jgi:hypothetical protein
LPLFLVCSLGAAAGDGIPIPVRPPAETLARPAAPLEVAELVLRDAKGTALAPPLVMAEGEGYDWSAGWRAPAPVTGGDYRLAVTLDISGPLVASETGVSWSGSTPGACAGRLEIPPATGSGRAVLRVVLLPGASAGKDPGWVLAVLPVAVTPCPAESRVSPDRIRELFGAAARPLGRRVRVGPGASVDLAVPDPSVAFSRVVVVSSVGWLPRQDRRRAGQVLATVTPVPVEGRPESFPLRLGRETLQTDHEAFAREKALEKGAVPVFETWTAGDGGGRCNYWAEYRADRPRCLSAVRISHAGASGVLLVDEVVLVP